MKLWMGSVLCSVTESRPTLCSPMDCSPPGSFAHGVLWNKIMLGSTRYPAEYNYSLKRSLPSFIQWVPRLQIISRFSGFILLTLSKVSGCLSVKVYRAINKGNLNIHKIFKNSKSAKCLKASESVSLMTECQV